MTVSTTDSVIEYVSGGPAYPIPYRFLQNSDIEVVLVKQNGTSETLVLGTQYTLTGAGAQSGGTLTSAYAAGYLATTGADERSKCDIKPIDEACLRAWANVEYMQYKFKDAVEAKADGARWHFGLIAQRVQKAFEDEGLDAFEYGLLCYDEWDETPATYVTKQLGRVFCVSTGEVVAEDVECQTIEPGYEWLCTHEVQELDQPYKPAGNRYGIRYEEALVLECAYLRSKLNP